MSERNPSDLTDEELLLALRETIAAERRLLDEALVAVKAGRQIDLFTLDLLRDDLGDEVVDTLMEAWTSHSKKLRE